MKQHKATTTTRRHINYQPTNKIALSPKYSNRHIPLGRFLITQQCEIPLGFTQNDLYMDVGKNQSSLKRSVEKLWEQKTCGWKPKFYYHYIIYLSKTSLVLYLTCVLTCRLCRWALRQQSLCTFGQFLLVLSNICLYLNLYVCINIRKAAPTPRPESGPELAGQLIWAAQWFS